MCEQPLTIILRRPLLALSHLRIYLDIKLNRHLNMVSAPLIGTVVHQLILKKKA